MIASEIVIGVAMGPRVIPAMLCVSQIIIQMQRAGYALGTAIVIYSKEANPMSCPTLLIRFDSYASLALKTAYPTLSSMGSSIQESSTGNQENTRGLTNIKHTLILALRKKLTMTGLFFKYLC